MWRRALSHFKTLAPWRSRSRSICNLRHRPNGETLNRPFSTDQNTSSVKKVEDVMPIATGVEREELEAELQGRKRFDMDPPVGPFGTKLALVKEGLTSVLKISCCKTFMEPCLVAEPLFGGRRLR